MSQALFEKHRPASWSAVVGQDKAVNTLRTLERRGFAGHAFWVSGLSGTGKTCIARLIAASMADPFFVIELDAGQVTAATLESLEKDLRLCAWGKGGRAIIVNEAHGLSKPIIRRLLGLLEPIPPHTVWVFTTTCDGQERLFEAQEDAGPLLSRCIPIRLARRDISQPFAEHVRGIACAEHLNGRPVSAYLALAREHRNNMRAMLQDVERGRMLAQ